MRTLLSSDGLIAAAPALWREHCDLYPHVVSGDPDHHSMLLVTRRLFTAGAPRLLATEVVPEPSFRMSVVRMH